MEDRVQFLHGHLSSERPHVLFDANVMDVAENKQISLGGPKRVPRTVPNLDPKRNLFWSQKMHCLLAAKKFFWGDDVMTAVEKAASFVVEVAFKGGFQRCFFFFFFF